MCIITSLHFYNQSEINSEDNKKWGCLNKIQYAHFKSNSPRTDSSIFVLNFLGLGVTPKTHFWSFKAILPANGLAVLSTTLTIDPLKHMTQPTVCYISLQFYVNLSVFIFHHFIIFVSVHLNIKKSIMRAKITKEKLALKRISLQRGGEFLKIEYIFKMNLIFSCQNNSATSKYIFYK